ncbi:pyrroloquinoline quinone precursor peptide PqqA [Bradyrhizobium sp. PRIMUS42]|nr:pyrroloquinoline quinone precursor peptide PqqA [Bradyrhizobium sp. PRIMUS42]MCJ9728657.1 pyrroloquinoline quinone precursor peptide PqqA [Bradyrhizobium sp. PRIMUS42]
MKWTPPKIVEVSVGMEINMYASARGCTKAAMR